MRNFMDGTVGIRVEDMSNVKVRSDGYSYVMFGRNDD